MQAPRDENRIPVIMGVSIDDEITLRLIEADPVSHAICMEDGVTGNYSNDGIAKRDENRVCGLMAVSSNDGITPIALYVDGDNCLLTKSN